jgi:hypothetical protein
MEVSFKFPMTLKILLLLNEFISIFHFILFLMNKLILNPTKFKYNKQYANILYIKFAHIIRSDQK